MNKQIIKDAKTKDGTKTLQVYRMAGAFFFDIKENSYLIERRYFEDLGDALSDYYSFVNSAYLCGTALERVK